MRKTGMKYDDAVLGEELGCSVCFATGASIREYAAVTEDFDPIYWDEDAAGELGFEKPVAPSGYHIQYTAMKWAIGQDLYVPQGSVHVKQKYKIFKEVCEGDCLTTSVCVSDKYIKKGRKYLTYRATITNQHGEVVAVSEMTNILAEEVAIDVKSTDQ